MIVGSGNSFMHHKYKKCEKCKKKGVYKPLNEMTRDKKGIIIYAPTCRECGHIYKENGKAYHIKNIGK
jgi:hypothetical protein